MPCYEMNLISVEFQGKSLDVFKKMDARIDGNMVYVSGVEINLATGKATANSQSTINKVKRDYSKTVVGMIAKKQMWQKKQSGNKITLTKW